MRAVIRDWSVFRRSSWPQWDEGGQDVEQQFFTPRSTLALFIEDSSRGTESRSWLSCPRFTAGPPNADQEMRNEGYQIELQSLAEDVRTRVEIFQPTES